MSSLGDIIRSDHERNPEAWMEAVADGIGHGEVEDGDIVDLALVLARSGTREPVTAASPGAADVASTGGPTSLSTLLCPLYLRALGSAVPKLGVPGRPAGGVDVLAQIPGYDVDMGPDQVRQCLQTCGYAHFLAGRAYAPLDAAFFTYRQHTGRQNMPALVIASLLSKKIAVSVDHVGLDVRVGTHGNFGRDWASAALNARRFCRIARMVDIKAVCFLTDASTPYQPYVGRGEALLALQAVFDRTSCPVLNRHTDCCFAMARATLDDFTTDRPTPAVLESSFAANLAAQGGSMENFRAKTADIGAKHVYNLCAERAGFLRLDQDILRAVLTDAQAARTSDVNRFPDSAGLILKKFPGDYTEAGEEIASVRCEPDIWKYLQTRLVSAFASEGLPTDRPEFEVIHDTP